MDNILYFPQKRIFPKEKRFLLLLFDNQANQHRIIKSNRIPKNHFYPKTNEDIFFILDRKNLTFHIYKKLQEKLDDGSFPMTWEDLSSLGHALSSAIARDWDKVWYERLHSSLKNYLRPFAKEKPGKEPQNVT